MHKCNPDTAAKAIETKAKEVAEKLWNASINYVGGHGLFVYIFFNFFLIDGGIPELVAMGYLFQFSFS